MLQFSDKNNVSQQLDKKDCYMDKIGIYFSKFLEIRKNIKVYFYSLLDNTPAVYVEILFGHMQKFGGSKVHH